MSSLSGINHVTLARRIVELPVPEHDGRHALIEIGGSATLHPFELPRIQPPLPQPMFARGRTDHFALNAPDADTFEALRSRLLERGATDGEVTDFGVMRVLTFTDPDGHTVELAHWVGGADPASLDMSQASDDALTQATAASSHTPRGLSPLRGQAGTLTHGRTLPPAPGITSVSCAPRLSGHGDAQRPASHDIPDQ